MARPSLTGNLRLRPVGATPVGDVASRIGETIRAYHGGPNSFDRFDLGMIGSGTGAQSHGRGLYFAEDPGTAEDYRRLTAGSPDIQRLKIGDLVLTPRNNFDYSPRGASAYENIRSSLAEDMLVDQYGLVSTPEAPREMALRLLDERIGRLQSEWPEALPDAMRLRRDLEADDAVSLQLGPRPGATYEVDIAARPDEFLDWEAPIESQSEAIRQVFKGLPGKTRGGDAYNSLAYGVPPSSFDGSGAAMFDAASSLSGRNTADASAKLRDAGVVGTRYLDPARKKGTDTRNLVLFRDDIIRIIRKYGIAGLMASPVVAAMMAGQSAQDGGV